jgi:pimeloyl-ACP methyl ester carboxylesterase
MTMHTRHITAGGYKITVAEAGSGAPLVYLHGFVDVHAASVGWLPFHDALAHSFTVIAPAFPACADSDEDEDIETIDDVAFRWIEVLDALGLATVDLAGTCFGGWVAAELAVRHPERINRLALISASGLYVPGQPIGDLFMEIQPRNGSDYAGLRHLLFAHPEAPEALALLPNGRASLDVELSRFKAMRYCSRVGFHPPYFYNRKLRQRLARYQGPALVIAGDADHMVPIEHAYAYKDGLAGARLCVLPGCGHSPHVERMPETVAALRAFFGAVPR